MLLIEAGSTLRLKCSRSRQSIQFIGSLVEVCAKESRGPRSGIDHSKPSCQGHYLADDFSIVVIPQPFLWLIVGREGINHQRAVLETAASAYVGSVPSQQHIYWLLPPRLRPGVNGLFLMAIHNYQQPVCEQRMERVGFSLHPKEIMQGKSFQARQMGE